MRTPRIAATVGTVLLAAACSSTPETDAGNKGPELPGKTTEQSSPRRENDNIDNSKPETNERGYIPKKLGEEARYGKNPTSESASVFVIDKVEINPPCHQYGLPNEDGETLLLHVRVATGDDQTALLALSGVLNPFAFAEITQDGVTEQAQMGMCTDPADALPGQFGVNQKYRGTIELVVPEASGTLVLDDFGEGWEWTYPTK